MTNTTAANGKEAAYHGVPAEDDYGYAQAIKIGNAIHVSGQLSHDDKGTKIAPAALDELVTLQYFRDIQRRDGGGRFIVKSSVTSCRSSADDIATVSHFPSMYVLASS